MISCNKMIEIVWIYQPWPPTSHLPAPRVAAVAANVFVISSPIFLLQQQNRQSWLSQNISIPCINTWPALVYSLCPSQTIHNRKYSRYVSWINMKCSAGRPCKSNKHQKPIIKYYQTALKRVLPDNFFITWNYRLNEDGCCWAPVFIFSRLCTHLFVLHITFQW